jgi:hypothetical protein
MASIEPRSGIVYGWGVGSSGWAPDMDANLIKLGRFGFHLSVLDRDLAAPPGSPTAGDTYIVATGGTGAWAGKDGQVAVWDGAAWAFGEPSIGWVVFLEDEEKLSAYKVAGWSVGVAI